MQRSLFTGDQQTTDKPLLAKDSESAQVLYFPKKVDDQAVIEQALKILESRIQRTDGIMATPSDMKAYARLKIGDRKHEVFGVFYLSAQNAVIEFEELFRGTLTQTSVYPREVVISALRNNAAGVIFTHNHPSGTPKPSHADEALTRTLKMALGLVDVRVLDHIIVTAGETYSMAEAGLL